MQFSDQLRASMGEMTQAELAEASKIPQATISRYLDGSIKPGFERLQALEHALPKLLELRLQAAGMRHAV